MDRPITQSLRPIPAWSYSALRMYKRCPLAAKFRYCDRVTTPEPPEHSPLVRGIKYHKNAEEYVRGQVRHLFPTLEQFKEFYDEWRIGYNAGTVTVEEEWAFNRDLKQTQWAAPDVWLRVKCDVVVHDSDTEMTLVDLKTGNKWGNEVAHTQQGQLYAFAATLLFPKLEYITVMFLYPDVKTTFRRPMNAETVKERGAKFIEDGLLMTSVTEFQPKPNNQNCKYCDYGIASGNGHCPYAVQKL